MKHGQKYWKSTMKKAQFIAVLSIKYNLTAIQLQDLQHSGKMPPQSDFINTQVKVNFFTFCL